MPAGIVSVRRNFIRYMQYNHLMNTQSLPRLDKTAFSIAFLHDETDEKAYWLSKTPLERLASVEIMRHIIYDYDPLVTRLQRVLEITQRSSG